MLSRNNHSINKDEEIPGMSININAVETCIDILECMTAEEIELVTLDEELIGVVLNYVIIKKGRRRIIPVSLQKKAVYQHMGPSIGLT